ncbi:hypothetical protein HYH03_001891 [Edaphochlamys debaryana]|uniref:BTB domain-containing protein n=1 Tax=Edaphochlamys debaryana TaxID=47281 RepID=A0A835YKM3_9CHLO|nr:hypothetical protein HYH03_001891 [Edaphochlamys debaryana]|eukprot:KAG2500315.1 hypothetical protein HYH03_001891 [Edaphochlamys debaryana]
MPPYKCKLCVSGEATGVATRPGTGLAEVETIVVTGAGRIHPLVAAGKELVLGPELDTYEVGEEIPAERTRYQSRPGVHLSSPCYDPFSGSVFVRLENAVGRLTADNTLSVVAGCRLESGEVDGLGVDARLTDPAYICSNGRGLLYTLGGAKLDRIAHLQLPESWRAGASPDAPVAANALAGAGEERVKVTTLPYRAASRICGLAYHPSAGPDGDLIIATRTALYRLPLNPDGSPAAPAPLLLAGREGEWGDEDGRGEEARFCGLWGCVVNGDGAVIVADNYADETQEESQEEDDEEAVVAITWRTAVRRVAPDGTVTTLGSGAGPLTPAGSAMGLKGTFGRPFILPSGHLCLGASRDSAIRLLDVGLKPCPLLCPAPKARAPCGSLHADMGALLDAQPDGTADLTLVVGDRRFPVHRAILIARSDYFQQRLQGGFADGAAAELSLPDVDPADAFALVLRWLYTGAVDIPSALAPAVAELADRLLLPELCSDAQVVVLSGVSAETVVGSLLWAERLGGSFAPLLAELKEWLVEHYDEVADCAEPSLERLLAANRRLALGLMAGLSSRSAKRRRTA